MLCPTFTVWSSKSCLDVLSFTKVLYLLLTKICTCNWEYYKTALISICVLFGYDLSNSIQQFIFDLIFEFTSIRFHTYFCLTYLNYLVLFV